MNEQQFKEAAIYATANLSADDYNGALIAIGDKLPIPHHICTEIADYMNDWCDDHEIEPDEWRYYGDEAEVILAGDDPDKQQICIKLEDKQGRKINIYQAKPRTVWMLSNSLQRFLFWKKEDAVKEARAMIDDYLNRNNNPEHPYIYNLIVDIDDEHCGIIECTHKEGKYRKSSLFLTIQEMEVY